MSIINTATPDDYRLEAKAGYILNLLEVEGVIDADVFHHWHLSEPFIRIPLGVDERLEPVAVSYDISGHYGDAILAGDPEDVPESLGGDWDRDTPAEVIAAGIASRIRQWREAHPTGIDPQVGTVGLTSTSRRTLLVHLNVQLEPGDDRNVNAVTQDVEAALNVAMEGYSDDGVGIRPFDFTIPLAEEV